MLSAKVLGVVTMHKLLNKTVRLAPNTWQMSALVFKNSRKQNPVEELG